MLLLFLQVVGLVGRYRRRGRLPPSSIFSPEDGDSMFLRNVSK
jgi:hypothetical protein